MSTPARQRILDAALGLIRQKGIGRVTTREIATAADAAEGSLFKNFGDKMGLLTELLSYELPENLPTGNCCAATRLATANVAPARNWPCKAPWTACAAGRKPATSTRRRISTP